MPPFEAEPQTKPGISWWQTLPATKTHESNRNKCVHCHLNSDIKDLTGKENTTLNNNQSEANDEGKTMQVECKLHGVESKKTKVESNILRRRFFWTPLTKLKVGDIQHMSFSETDEGTYYLKGIARETR